MERSERHRRGKASSFFFFFFFFLIQETTDPSQVIPPSLTRVWKEMVDRARVSQTGIAVIRILEQTVDTCFSETDIFAVALEIVRSLS